MSKWGESMRQRHNAFGQSERKSAPLRKIIELVRIGNNDLFGSGDKVLLECGHEVYSKATYNARCLQCRKLKLNTEIRKNLKP